MAGTTGSLNERAIKARAATTCAANADAVSQKTSSESFEEILDIFAFGLNVTGAAILGGQSMLIG